jgi:hypothetical protein
MMYKTEAAQRAQAVPAPYTVSEQTGMPRPVVVRMGIKGLTDRAPEFPRIGELRKGDVKREANRPGADLNQFFRFTSTDPEVLKRFVDTFGTQPASLIVYLPHQHADEVFTAWKEEWSQGGLVHRCNGELCAVWRGSDGKYYTEPRPCPGGCKETGRLKVVIPDIGRLAYITVLTTSKNDIMHLSSQLAAYESLRGDLRGIPFRLCRLKAKISTPGANGQRARREKWLISIEPSSQWVDLQIEATRLAALPRLPQTQTLALPAPEYDDAEWEDARPDEDYEADNDDTPPPAAQQQPTGQPEQQATSAQQQPTGNGGKRDHPPTREELVERMRELATESQALGQPVELNLTWLVEASDRELIAEGKRLKAAIDALKAAPQQKML